VDGKYNYLPFSVDGMGFRPHHSGLYELLWELAGLELELGL
jgi:hypothetical protein